MCFDKENFQNPLVDFLREKYTIIIHRTLRLFTVHSSLWILLQSMCLWLIPLAWTYSSMGDFWITCWYFIYTSGISLLFFRMALLTYFLISKASFSSHLPQFVIPCNFDNKQSNWNKVISYCAFNFKSWWTLIPSIFLSMYLLTIFIETTLQYIFLVVLSFMDISLRST